jgi:hypothetical protein
MRTAAQVSILLLSGCLASTSARGQAALSTRDSASIALLIANRITPQLRSVSGADSTNAVCVSVGGGSGSGTFMRVLDSALRSTTGGAVVAPISISPLRGVFIDSFTAAGDSAWVNWRTTGGGLARGEMAWTHGAQWRLIRRDSTWTVVNPVRGIIGDGYIRADLPKPPNPPACLARRLGCNDCQFRSR